MVQNINRMESAYMIKLVALDLDGTIVNEHLRISERTLKTLRHVLTETDVRVVVATGRMFASALPFAREIGIVEPLVIYQGAMIRSLNAEQTLHFHQPIPLTLAKPVLELLKEGKYHANLYLNDVLWTTPHPEYASIYAKTSGVTPQIANCLVNTLDNHAIAPTKIMAIEDERIDHLLDRLKEQFGPALSVCKSRYNFCEIIDADASKWNALQHLAAQWGIQPEEIMAVGDQGNDLSMIKNAGIGVAMGQAPDEVKQFANFVTAPIDEDGAAKAIEQFVLDGHMPLKDEMVAKG